MACYLPLQLLAGINLYGRLRPGFWAAALTAAGILALHPFQALSSMPRALQFSLLLLHGLFFFIILLEVFIQLYRAQTHRLHLDARQTLCAGLSGLLLIGFSYGGMPTMTSTVTADCFGTQNYGTNFSIANMSMLPASFGATIVGAIQTGSGTYVTAFLVFLGVTAVVILLDLAFRGAAKKL